MSPQPDPPAARPVRVLVVDADHRVRESLGGLLELADGVEVVGSVGHVIGALDVCAERPPDVVVLDPRLPDVDAGLALLGALRRRYPRIRVAVLGWADAIENDALAGGVDTFIAKATPPTELVERIAALGEPAARSVAERDPARC